MTLLGTMPDDARILRALSGAKTADWKRVSWRLKIPGDKTMPLCAIIDGIEVELLPALDHSSHTITLVHRGVRFDWGSIRVLAWAKQRAYEAVQHTLAWEHLHKGVPAPTELVRYSHNIWVAHGPNTVIMLGRWVRSDAGTLRFSTDNRDFYEHRDELARWEFAPLSAEHGGVIRGWGL